MISIFTKKRGFHHFLLTGALTTKSKSTFFQRQRFVFVLFCFVFKIFSECVCVCVCMYLYMLYSVALCAQIRFKCRVIVKMCGAGDVVSSLDPATVGASRLYWEALKVYFCTGDVGSLSTGM